MISRREFLKTATSAYIFFTIRIPIIISMGDILLKVITQNEEPNNEIINPMPKLAGTMQVRILKYLTRRGFSNPWLNFLLGLLM